MRAPADYTGSMNSRRIPATGAPRAETTLAMSEAVNRSEPLASLSRRLRESAARFDHVAPLLPQGLRASIKPGPVDEEGWSLLAANPAVAAKLRQVVPRLESALSEGGFHPPTVRVKISGAWDGSP